MAGPLQNDNGSQLSLPSVTIHGYSQTTAGVYAPHLNSSRRSGSQHQEPLCHASSPAAVANAKVASSMPVVDPAQPLLLPRSAVQGHVPHQYGRQEPSARNLFRRSYQQQQQQQPSMHYASRLAGRSQHAINAEYENEGPRAKSLGPVTPLSRGLLAAQTGDASLMRRTSSLRRVPMDDVESIWRACTTADTGSDPAAAPTPHERINMNIQTSAAQLQGASNEREPKSSQHLHQAANVSAQSLMSTEGLVPQQHAENLQSYQSAPDHALHRFQQPLIRQQSLVGLPADVQSRFRRNSGCRIVSGRITADITEAPVPTDPDPLHGMGFAQTMSMAGPSFVPSSRPASAWATLAAEGPDPFAGRFMPQIQSMSPSQAPQHSDHQHASAAADLTGTFAGRPMPQVLVSHENDVDLAHRRHPHPYASAAMQIPGQYIFDMPNRRSLSTLETQQSSTCLQQSTSKAPATPAGHAEPRNCKPQADCGPTMGPNAASPWPSSTAKPDLALPRHSQRRRSQWSSLGHSCGTPSGGQDPLPRPLGPVDSREPSAALASWQSWQSEDLLPVSSSDLSVPAPLPHMLDFLDYQPSATSAQLLACPGAPFSALLAGSSAGTTSAGVAPRKRSAGVSQSITLPDAGLHAAMEIQAILGPDLAVPVMPICTTGSSKAPSDGASATASLDHPPVPSCEPPSNSQATFPASGATAMGGPLPQEHCRVPDMAGTLHESPPPESPPHAGERIVRNGGRRQSIKRPREEGIVSAASEATTHRFRKHGRRTSSQAQKGRQGLILPITAASKADQQLQALEQITLVSEKVTDSSNMIRVLII